MRSAVITLLLLTFGVIPYLNRQASKDNILWKDQSLDVTQELIEQIDTLSLLKAAVLLEQGDTSSFQNVLFHMGEALNETLASNLKLSVEVKAEMDSLLRKNHKAISNEIREQYLASIQTLPVTNDSSFHGNNYTTKSFVLAQAMATYMCSFSTLILLPLNINLSIISDLTLNYIIQTPCQQGIQGLVNRIGIGLNHTGVALDSDVILHTLKTMKEGGKVELSAAEIEIIDVYQFEKKRQLKVYNRQLANWKAASLNIEYQALVRCSFDFSDSLFQIARDDGSRIITVYLPEPKIQVALDPLVVEVDDPGFPDIESIHYRSAYDSVKVRSIQLAEKKGIQQTAEANAINYLSVLFSPITDVNGPFPYQLKFNFVISINH